AAAVPADRRPLLAPPPRRRRRRLRARAGRRALAPLRDPAPRRRGGLPRRAHRLVDRPVRKWIFLAFLAFYLVGGSRAVLWADSKAAYRVAEHLLAAGKIDIGYPWPEGAPAGRDGKFYSVYPILPSLVQVPAAATQSLVRRISPAAAKFSFPLLSHVSCAA